MVRLSGCSSLMPEGLVMAKRSAPASRSLPRAWRRPLGQRIGWTARHAGNGKRTYAHLLRYAKTISLSGRDMSVADVQKCPGLEDTTMTRIREAGREIEVLFGHRNAELWHPGPKVAM